MRRPAPRGRFGVALPLGSVRQSKPRLANQTTAEEEMRALPGACSYFLVIGHRALIEHCGALRIHAHHAAQHASRELGIIKSDRSAFALTAKPGRYAVV